MSTAEYLRREWAARRELARAREAAWSLLVGRRITFLDQRGRRVAGLVLGEDERNGVRVLRVETDRCVALVAESQRPRVEEGA